MPIFATRYLTGRRAGTGSVLMAPGAGAILGGLTLASITRFPRPHQLLVLLAGGFASSIILFAASGNFPLSLLSLFFRGWISDYLPLFDRHPFASLHGRKQPGTHHVCLGLINRGLGPMGSFPFGLVATWIGAPLTVGTCGLLSISLAAAFFTGVRTCATLS